MKIRAQHSLISLCVVILARISSSLFSRDRTLVNKRLGSGGWLARAFSLALFASPSPKHSPGVGWLTWTRCFVAFLGVVAFAVAAGENDG